MKLIGGLLLVLLGVAATVQGVTILRLRREVKTLSTRVEDLNRGGDEGPSPADRLADGLRQMRAPDAPSFPPRLGAPDTLGAPGSALPAAAQPGPATLPLPPPIASPEAREQLHQFVAAEMQRVRAEEREQWMGQREEREQALRDRAVKELGLNEDEARKVGDLLGQMQTGRREAFQGVREGKKTPAEAQQEVAALRDKVQQGLKDTLGDERTKKLQDLQREQRQAGGGGPGGGPFGFLPRR